jgi:hypothetical protein
MQLQDSESELQLESESKSQSITPNPKPELLVAHGAFATAADRERFEQDVLPSARAFLGYWAEAGLHVPHGQARIFISPPPDTKALEALPKLYGDKIFDEIRALETRVASAANTKAALDLVDAFACSYPPLHRKQLEKFDRDVEDPKPGAAMLTPAVIAEVLKKRHDELTAAEGSFYFSTDNGEFELPLRRTCSYILAGHATDKTRAHPFLEKDVINHELGHALHYGLWLESGVVGERLSSTANESIADILAHIFDADPCHGKVLDAAGKVTGCRRTMVGYERSVSEDVWSAGTAGHASGQALRDLIWTLRSQVDEAKLKQALRDGIAAIQPVLNAIDKEPFSNVPLFDDEILRIRYEFVREYEAANAFFGAVCKRVGMLAVCDEHEARIGDPRLAMRATWLRNAPTAISAQGLMLADGRRVAFEVAGRDLRSMSITDLNGELTRYEAVGDAEQRDSTTGDVTLWFGKAEQAGWSSDGTVRMATRSVAEVCGLLSDKQCALDSMCEVRYETSCECSCADGAPGCAACAADCFFPSCVQHT